MPRRPQALQVAIGEQPYRAGHGDDALAARLLSSTPVLRTSVSPGVSGTMAVRLTCRPTIASNVRCHIEERAS